MSDEWNHIVIGAGHNGLTAAATLAEGGSRVLVVERLPVLGGLTTSLARRTRPGTCCTSGRWTTCS